MADILTHRVYEKKIKMPKQSIGDTPLAPPLDNAHTLHFDKSYKMKLGSGAAGIIVHGSLGNKVFEEGILLQETKSKNEAEYLSLI